MELEIVWKLDMERLCQNNEEKVLERFLPEELTWYKTHDKVYGKEMAV